MSFDDNRGSLTEAGTMEEPQTETPEPVSSSTESQEPALEASTGPEAAPDTSAAPEGMAASEPAGSGPSASESGEISALLESVDGLSTIAAGEVIPATVVKLTETEVVIDVGLKCEGAIPRAEFLGLDGQVTVAPGDTVPVLIEYYNERQGTVRASYQKAAQRRAWDEVERAYREQTTIRGKVIGRIKGGLTVDVGIPAFLPGSHTDARPHFNADTLLGQEVALKVIKVNRKRNNAVVSRRLVVEEEQAARKALLLEKLREGAVLTGRVKNMTDYGVFVDLGGMDGLLHITDLSWGRVGKPSDVVQPGQELRVKVLKYDAEKGRVSLGLKQLTPDPWSQVPKKYQVGDRKTGRVVGIVDYGVFVELEPGVEGLIHVSEMSWSKRLKHPSKLVSLGEQVEVSVLDVNMAQRRISLSLKHSLPDPWATLPQRLAVGAVVEGRVRNLTEFGAFVEIEEGVDGLVHLSNMSWAKDVQHPSEILKKGQKIEVAVLGLDPVKRRVSLGLKQVGPDAWTDFCSRVRIGDVVRGKVVRLTPFGAFVEIEAGVEGLCHTSEIDTRQGGKGSRRLEAGREYNFRILRLNPADKKVALSMKEVEQEARRAVAPPEAAALQPEQSPEPVAETETVSAPEPEKMPEAVTESAPEEAEPLQASAATQDS
jgi:small subunit ribosomal protein S1